MPVPCPVDPVVILCDSLPPDGVKCCLSSWVVAAPGDSCPKERTTPVVPDRNDGCGPPSRRCWGRFGAPALHACANREPPPSWRSAKKGMVASVALPDWGFSCGLAGWLAGLRAQMHDVHAPCPRSSWRANGGAGAVRLLEDSRMRAIPLSGS